MFLRPSLGRGERCAPEKKPLHDMLRWGGKNRWGKGGNEKKGNCSRGEDHFAVSFLDNRGGGEGDKHQSYQSAGLESLVAMGEKKKALVDKRATACGGGVCLYLFLAGGGRRNEGTAIKGGGEGTWGEIRGGGGGTNF